MRIVIPFAELSASDLAQAGGKGANLGELTRAGLPVPPGFVIGTDAYRAVAAGEVGERVLAAALGDPDAAAETARDAFAHAPIPPDIVEAITAAYRQLPQTPTSGPADAPTRGVAVAVRSSATAEDLGDASFAGLQETYLNVRGEEALIQAVRRCWASLWTARALAYRGRRSIAPSEVAIAVVVQRLVDAESSGVAFSVNPANGRPDQIAIDAAWGLGEAVVSGRVTPDHLIVAKADGRVIERTTADKAVRTIRTGEGTREDPVPAHLRNALVLSDADAATLASLVARIEEHYGRPQDIEWARAGRDFFVVQSRPITALPEPVGDVPTEWPVEKKGTWYFRASVVEQMPDPLTPLFGDLIGPAVLETVTAMMERFVGEGVIRPGEAGFARVNGYGYLACGMRAIGRVTIKAAPAMVKLNRDPESSAEVLWTRMHADYVATLAEVEQHQPGDLSAAGLLDEVKRLLHAGALYYTSVQTVIPQAATSEIYFTRAYAALGRLKGVKAEDFLLGLDSAPIRADKALWDLAQWVRSHQLAELVEAHPSTGSGNRMAELVEAPSTSSGSQTGSDADWAEWQRRFSEHLHRYGHTVYNLDFANPVPADDPAPILEALRYYLTDDAKSPYDRQAALLERRRAALAALDQLSAPRRRLLRRLLAKYELYGPMREDALADVGLAWPRMRADLAELGRRLTDAGLIPTASDVFWLTEPEASSLAKKWDAAGAGSGPAGHAGAGRSATDATASEVVTASDIESRKATWRGQKRARPPQILGAGKGVWERFMPSVEGQTGDELKGIGSSGGVVTAPARVIRGTDDFAAMRPGEVLVAEITTPAYTPLFALASAVVTDVGGPLSHSSIVAREYGIPAVLGTGSATHRIVTGQTVTVDGTAGRVTLNPSPARADSSGVSEAM